MTLTALFLLSFVGCTEPVLTVDIRTFYDQDSARGVITTIDNANGNQVVSVRAAGAMAFTDDPDFTYFITEIPQEQTYPLMACVMLMRTDPEDSDCFLEDGWLEASTHGLDLVVVPLDDENCCFSIEPES